jgi:ribosomal protein S18 acetylase RimI-like enzyme
MEKYHRSRINTPDQSKPKADSEINLSEPINLTISEQLVDFFLTYARLQKDPIKFGTDIETWAKEKANSALEEQKNQEMENKKNNQPKKYFFGVYDGQKMIATGEIHIFEESKQAKKHAHLCHLTVDPAYRNKQIGRKLVEVRTDLARREGCEFLTTRVNTRNLPGMQNKFNEGFYINGVKIYRKKEPVWSEFEFRKEIGGKPKQTDTQDENATIPLYDPEIIKQKIADGQVGVGLIPTEPYDINIKKSVYEDGDVRKFALKMQKG